VPAEPDSERRAQPVRDAQRARRQVGGAARHDGQRDRGAGQGLGAGTDGAVTADGEDQARAGGDRPAGQ